MKQVLFAKTRALKPKPNGDVDELWYETIIDISALHLLAKKASRNKSQCAKGGPIEVRITEPPK